MATFTSINQHTNDNSNDQQPEQRRIFDWPLSSQRYEKVSQILRSRPDITSVSDFGCSNARFTCWLKNVPHLDTINLLDVDEHVMEMGLYNNYNVSLVEALFGRKNNCLVDLKIRAFLGDLNWLDDQVMADCITMIEVIEHLVPADVEQAKKAIFGYYQPKLAIITTPNREFNHLLRREGEPANTFRHSDHKFEWDRCEFIQWAQDVCLNYNYTVNFDGVGQLPGSEPYGFCTQIATFQRTTEQPDTNTREYIKFQAMMDNLDLSRELPDLSYSKEKRVLSQMTQYTLPAQKNNTDEVMDEDLAWNED